MLSNTWEDGCYARNARILDLELTKVGTLCFFIRCSNKKINLTLHDIIFINIKEKNVLSFHLF